MWGTNQSVVGSDGKEIDGKVVSTDVNGNPTRIVGTDGKLYERRSYNDHTFTEQD